MNILFIFLGGSIILFIAYKTYGTFISKKIYELDDSHKMPSVELEDGLDYVPTDAKFLAGQHFSAIAAAGPVTGPILAGAAFGWVPTLLWILGGTIFIGGVHDMGALVASIRNKGRSITETVRVHVSRRAWIGFNASHSYGAMLFGLVYGHLAVAHPALLLGSPFLLSLGLALLLAYVQLARRYWFSVPFRGLLLSAALYAGALVLLIPAQ